MKKLILFPAALCLLFSLTSCAKQEETIPFQTTSTVIADSPADSSVSSTDNPGTSQESTIGTASTTSAYSKIVSTHQKYVVFDSGENITWTNSNKLLNPDSEFYCENAIGMKTGTTGNAGNCLIAAFVRNEKTYISVVMGCDTDHDRYSMTIERWKDNSA